MSNGAIDPFKKDSSYPLNNSESKEKGDRMESCTIIHPSKGVHPRGAERRIANVDHIVAASSISDTKNDYPIPPERFDNEFLFLQSTYMGEFPVFQKSWEVENSVPIIEADKESNSRSELKNVSRDVEKSISEHDNKSMGESKVSYSDRTDELSHKN